MKVFVEIAEAAERLEELIELAARGDDILICREERPVVALTYIATKKGAMNQFMRLAAEGRPGVPAGTTSNHDDFYDEHGLPK
jgi:antitoxin (DNA-binding transcriptional repressor) of toxin-antitoxin stability system